MLQISETAGSRYFAKLMFLKISQNSDETPVLEYLFSKVTSLQPITLLKQRLQHGCLPVNFAKSPKHLFYSTSPTSCFWNLLKIIIAYCYIEHLLMIASKISLLLSHAHIGWLANLWFAQGQYKWRMCQMLFPQSQQND